MIHEGRYISGIPRESILAHFIMTSEDDTTNDTLKKDWDPGGDGGGSGAADVMFTPEELDIYCNKVTLEAYIFHGKEIDYESIDHLEYNSKDYSVNVVHKDESSINLGVKIQWLVRPYFSKAKEVSIVRTKDGDSIDGTVVPLIHKGQEKE